MSCQGDLISLPDRSASGGIHSHIEAMKLREHSAVFPPQNRVEKVSLLHRVEAVDLPYIGGELDLPYPGFEVSLRGHVGAVARGFLLDRYNTGVALKYQAPSHKMRVSPSRRGGYGIQRQQQDRSRMSRKGSRDFQGGNTVTRQWRQGQREQRVNPDASILLVRRCYLARITTTPRPSLVERGQLTKYHHSMAQTHSMERGYRDK